MTLTSLLGELQQEGKTRVHLSEQRTLSKRGEDQNTNFKPNCMTWQIALR